MSKEIYKITNETFVASVQRNGTGRFKPGAIDRIAFAFEGWQLANKTQQANKIVSSSRQNERG